MARGQGGGWPAGRPAGRLAPACLLLLLLMFDAQLAPAASLLLLMFAASPPCPPPPSSPTSSPHPASPTWSPPRPPHVPHVLLPPPCQSHMPLPMSSPMSSPPHAASPTCPPHVHALGLHVRVAVRGRREHRVTGARACEACEAGILPSTLPADRPGHAPAAAGDDEGGRLRAARAGAAGLGRAAASSARCMRHGRGRRRTGRLRAQPGV